MNSAPSTAALLVIASLAAGCGSPQYKLVSTPTLPTALNLTATQPPAEVVLHSVVVHQGPGAWRRESYWDEYLIGVSHRGPTSRLVIESASLLDFQNATAAPGDDPWRLDAEGKAWWEKTQSTQTRDIVVLGAGATMLVVHELVAAGISELVPRAAWDAGVPTAAAASVAVLAVVPVLAITAVAVNAANKKEVAAEFARRRLVLPATVAPGATVNGSLFFRLAPGPQRLVLHGRAGDTPIEVVLDLTPLAGLHLKTPATTAGAKSPPAITR